MWFHSHVCTVNDVRLCFLAWQVIPAFEFVLSGEISQWIFNSYLCKKEKTEDEGAELNPDAFDGIIPTGSGENSPSLSVFACFYLETGILVTPDNEIIPFHEPSDKHWE